MYLSPTGDGLFCADGSGGMGAYYCKYRPYGRVIFNSKLDLEGTSLKGMAPAGPWAYTMSGSKVVSQCINFETCWEEPSDQVLEQKLKNKF